MLDILLILTFCIATTCESKLGRLRVKHQRFEDDDIILALPTRTAHH